MDRLECLTEAQKLICGDREDEYGSPHDNFALIAKLWEAYLECQVDAADVAAMMVLLKVARAATGNHKDDNYIDMAGYAGIACELASVDCCGGTEEKKINSLTALDAALSKTQEKNNECKNNQNNKE